MYENVNRNNGNPPIIHKTVIIVSSLKKAKLKKSFYIVILRWMCFLMIPLMALDDEYINRTKLTEQKNPIE